LEGRDIAWGETSDRQLVAVINAAFARIVMEAADPVGMRIRWGRGTIEVIGVVEDGKYQALTENATPAMFVPMQQFYNSTTTMIVRSAVPPEQMVATARQAIAALDPTLTLYGTGTVEQMLGFVLFPNQMAAIALTA